MYVTLLPSSISEPTSPQGITLKPDNLAVAENAEKQHLTGEAVTKTETETENSETENTEVSPPPRDKSNDALLAALTKLNAYLTTLRAALPPHTALLLFSGHSDPRSISTLAARRAECQTSQQQQGSSSNSGAAAGGARWSTADDRALDEAVIRARMGLLFVGVKT